MTNLNTMRPPVEETPFLGESETIGPGKINYP